MVELIDYQAQRIEALEKRVKELEEKLAKHIEVNEPIIFPNL
jgi:BMFP domain-containing protein YqiC